MPQRWSGCSLDEPSARMFMVSMVQEGKLNILIRGNGTVETRSEHLLALQRGLRVEKVQPVGSAVKQGDVILQYDKAYLQESIEKKQAEITKLELAVGQAQLCLLYTS